MVKKRFGPVVLLCCHSGLCLKTWRICLGNATNAARKTAKATRTCGIAVYKTKKIAIGKEGYALKHDFSWFFKKKSLPMRQIWFDAEKQHFNKMSRNVLKLAQVINPTIRPLRSQTRILSGFFTAACSICLPLVLESPSGEQISQCIAGVGLLHCFIDRMGKETSRGIWDTPFFCQVDELEIFKFPSDCGIFLLRGSKPYSRNTRSI